MAFDSVKWPMKNRDKEKGSMNFENGTLFLRGKIHV